MNVFVVPIVTPHKSFANKKNLAIKLHASVTKYEKVLYTMGY